MMALRVIRTVPRRNLFLPPVRMVSWEEKQYWLQMSKTQDVYPKQVHKKTEHFSEFGPLLSPAVFKTGHVKDNLTGSDSDGGRQTWGEENWDNISETAAPPFEQIAADTLSSRLSNSAAGELLPTTSYLGVSLLNPSRPNTNTTHVDMIHPADIFKIGHIRNPSIPSVSKVLAATKSEESKAALARWEKEKIAVLGLEGFKQLKADTFARGHTLHDILETYMQTKQLPKASDIPDSVSKRHLVSISQTVKQFDRPLLLESAVIHPECNYCGIVDCVAMVGDTLALVDWKTSEKVKNNSAALFDNPLQVAAYMGAINRDERYNRLGNLTKGAVVVVYNSGYPAMVHMFNTQQMEMYWEQWCQRLQMFHDMTK